jgi:cytochrome P450
MIGHAPSSALDELLHSPTYTKLCRFQLDDPYPALDVLRQYDPVHWSQDLEAWVVTRFDLVQECLRAPELINGRTAINMRAIHETSRPNYRSLEVHVSNWLGFTDPPKHTRMREVARSILSPAAAKQQLPQIKNLLQQQINLLQEKETFDLLGEFALPVPLKIICGILGVPVEDIAEFHRWSAEIAGFAGIMNPLPDDPTMRLVVRRADAARAEAEAYFTALLEARARSPQGDGTSALAAARDEGRLTDDEAIGLCVFILAAGHGTTSALIGNGLFLLLTQPSAWARLRRSPDLTAAAVEEILRYEGPIATVSRLPDRGLQIADRAVASGQAVVLHLAAANRDPDVFGAPGHFDITRSPNRHIAFGWGSHFCLGAPLARLQATAALEALLATDALAHWQLDGPPRWRLGEPDARELEELRVSWVA